MARRCVGSCSNLISAASTSTRKQARKMSSLKRRACTVKSGVAAAAAAAAKDGRSGSKEPCQNEGGKHEDAACHYAKHPHEMRQGGQIWRLHHEGSGLPQIDNEERMIVVVISRS